LVPHVVCRDTDRPIQLLREERIKEETSSSFHPFSSGFLSPSFLRSSPVCGYDQCLCSIMFPDSPEASVWRRDWPVSCSVSGPRWTAVLLMKCRGGRRHFSLRLHAKPRLPNARSMCEQSHRKCSGNWSPFPLYATAP